MTLKPFFRTAMASALLLLGACASQQSLQEYYIDNSENPDFLKLDIAASLLDVEEVELTEAQREAVSSLRKFNILAFRVKEDNRDRYKVERAKVKEILKDDRYTDLMKMNTGYGKGEIKFVGQSDAIDELVIFGDSKEKGFALIRVLGKDMNPSHVGELMEALQKADLGDGELGALGDFLGG